MAAYPRVSMGRPFQEKYADVFWEEDVDGKALQACPRLRLVLGRRIRRVEAQRTAVQDPELHWGKIYNSRRTDLAPPRNCIAVAFAHLPLPIYLAGSKCLLLFCIDSQRPSGE